VKRNTEPNTKRETSQFVEDWKVTQRLAKVRMILSEKFDNTLGKDDLKKIMK
jgi:hypothetical protein